MLRTVVFTLTVLLLSGMSQLRADTITITETVTASGSLGGTPYTNQLVTITGVGDTSNITNPSSGRFDLPLALSVDVPGIGSGMFLGSPKAIAFNSLNSAGFYTDTDITILDIGNAALSTYDLSTSIGPLTGSGTSFNSGIPFPTNAGAFIIDSISGNATFQAVVSNAAVPEPGSLLLTGIAALGVGAFWRRRKTAKPKVI